jgi:hypothetical protein
LAAGPAAAVPDDEPPLLELLLPEPLVLELPPELLPEELLLVGVLVIEAPLELLAVTDVPLEAGSLAAAGLSTAPPPHAASMASMASRAQPAPRISIAWYICCDCREREAFRPRLWNFNQYRRSAAPALPVADL